MIDKYNNGYFIWYNFCNISKLSNNINAKLIPLGTLQGAIDDLDDWMEKEVVVHCKSGGRSAAAKEFMMRQGFKNVRNLLGGMLAWQAKYG